MLTFKPVTARDAALLRRYYQHCGFRLCEYSAGVKLMWRRTLGYTWAETDGCLVVKCESGGHVSFDFPVAGPEGDEAAALSAVEGYCMERGIAPVFSVVPEEKAPVLLGRYPYVHISSIRTWRDYLYYKEDLQLFAGRRYSGQRNHIKKFRASWPEARFRPLDVKADAQAIERFWREFTAEFSDGGGRAAEELRLSQKMMALPQRPWIFRGGMFDGTRLIALCLCERCGETLIVHIEKALYSYAGVYPAMVQAEVEAFGQGCVWVNREDDAGDRGLRTSKLQYGPAELAPKYHVSPQNELLHHVKEIPVLKTQRLTLSALTEADIPAYNALVLDGERNRYWGYDDVGSLTAPMTERSFYDIARQDFARRQAVNFAVRLEGKLIGEAVLYRFDCRGGAELGCRIHRDYAGFGYGTEAFRAAAEWGLYRVELDRVYAKCYKENQPSYRMLSSCMRRRGEDETFYYFEMQV